MMFAGVFHNFALLFVVAVAVVALICIAYQLKRGADLKKAQLSSEVLTSLHRFHVDLGMDPKVSNLWREGLLDDEALSVAEKTQFNLLMTSAFIGFENIYLTHQDALLNDQVQDRAYRQMIFLFQNPGTRKWWRANKLNLTTSFTRYVEQEVMPTSDLIRESQKVEGEIAAPHGVPDLTPSND